MTHTTNRAQQRAHHLVLPFKPESARVARTELMSSVGPLLRGERREDARLVMSELVGNSVRHGQPLPNDTLQVSWRVISGELLLSVTDGGAPTKPQQRSAGVSDLGGRGLSIVASIALDWWVESTKSRSTVHARLNVN